MSMWLVLLAAWILVDVAVVVWVAHVRGLLRPATSLGGVRRDRAVDVRPFEAGDVAPRADAQPLRLVAAPR